MTQPQDTATTTPSSDSRLNVGRFAMVFSLVLLPGTFAWASSTNSWFSVVPLLLMHVGIPILDMLFKPDPNTAFDRSQAQHNWLARQAFDWPALCLPAWLIALFSTLYLSQDLTGVTWLLTMVGLGSVGGILAINPAHELIHRRSPTMRFAGGVLLAAVNYGAFKVEHVRGHHRWIGTDRDTASAKKGQNVYGFALRSVLGTLHGGFSLERKRLTTNRLPWYRHELLLWTTASAIFAIALFFMAGWQAVGGFFLVSTVAILELELINYIEHYGLRRSINQNGEPEKVTEHHSWNGNTWLVNAFLFNLQRHADHHAHPGREYLALRDMPSAPQLPLGYAAMMFLCLIPPLWFKTMDPRVDALKRQGLPQTPD